MESPPPVPLWSPTPEELHQLYQAKILLENPGLAARLANAIGSPIEKGFKMLPHNWSNVVHRATQAALTRALNVAVATLGSKQPRKRSSEKFHRLLVGASGGLGGAFGLASLPVELPVSTTLMLRSIADIARSEGHDLRTVPIRLSCLEVFALGGRSTADNAVESSYWAVRAALAKAITEAATYLGERGFIERAAPAVVRFIGAIASRFGVIVSEQVAAKAVPIIGAAGGATVNILFLNHFQDMARGHFIIKRLEAKHGSANVERVYRMLAIPMR
jgi:hypothetical protein